MKLLVTHRLLAKLVLAFVSALLPVLLLTVAGFRVDLRRSERSVLQNQTLTAEAVAGRVEENFDAALGLAWAIANDPVSQEANTAALDAHLSRLLQQYPGYDGVAVFDKNGQKRGWAGLKGRDRLPSEVRGTSYFDGVMGTNSPFISEVLNFSADGSNFGVIAAVPLRSEGDRIAGVVTVELNAAQLAKAYDEARLQAGQSIYLVDRNGRLAFHSGFRDLSFDRTLAYAKFDPIVGALSGEEQTFTNLESPMVGGRRLGAAVPTPVYRWAVGVTMARSVALAPVITSLRRDLVGFLASLLFTTVLAVVVASHLTAPLSLLRNQALDLGRGDFSRRVHVSTGDEIEELAEAVNAMAQQIQDRDAHLMATQERFRATFEQAAMGLAHIGLNGCWLRVNKRLCDLLGYEREKLLHKPFQDITYGDDVARELECTKKLVTGDCENYAIEKRYIRKDGSLVWTNLTVALARTPEGAPDYLIAVMEDISQRKQMEQDRAQLLEREQSARASAEAANRAKDQFLAMVSHELRTPLTPVIGALDLLTEEVNLTESAKESLRMIRGNVEMEARLIGDLLDLARLQQGKFELHRDYLDAHDVVRLVASFFGRELDGKQLKLELRLQAVERTLFADAGRLQQVLWNLLSNAIKFTPERGSIIVTTTNDAGKLKIEVADTGIGIKPETMARLFNPFEQGEQTLTRRYGGLGLGLNISKTLVEMHGGTIAAASCERGATFTVKLPLAAQPITQKPPAREPQLKMVHVPPSAGPAKDGYRILLVEDNVDTLTILSRLLQRAGYMVETATSAREAIRSEKKHRHDMLLSDIGLPDASGWELLQEIRKTSPEIAAVAMSGYSSPEDREKSREAGFCEHLIKPVNYSELRAAIQRVAHE